MGMLSFIFTKTRLWVNKTVTLSFLLTLIVLTVLFVTHNVVLTSSFATSLTLVWGNSVWVIVSHLAFFSILIFSTIQIIYLIYHLT